MSVVSKKQIVYFNVNYKCDNNCVFCFSNHIDNSLESNIRYSQFIECLSLVKDPDRVIINGGEPLLNPDIFDIINFSKQVSKEVVLYSNGNAFSDEKKATKIKNSGIDRVTIPIHGDKKLHCYITKNINSYDFVKTGLKKIQNMNFLNKIELKFIITNEMAEKEFDIASFLSDYPEIENIVICGQVNTETSKLNKHNVVINDYFYRYASKQLLNLLKKYNIKIYDFELCRLDENIQRLFTTVKNIVQQFDFYFFDINHLTKCIIPYNENRKRDSCKKCCFINCCSEILNKYTVLNISKELKCSLSFE